MLDVPFGARGPIDEGDGNFVAFCWEGNRHRIIRSESRQAVADAMKEAEATGLDRSRPMASR